MPWILHVDMDAFFPSVEQALNPKLKGLPVIVGAKPDERGVVSSASYEARSFGVRSAMPSRRAGQLCPHGIFIHGHYEAYQKYSAAIKKIFYHYTGAVEMVSLDEACLDFSGYELLYPDIPLIGRRIQQNILRETGLSCSVGAASARVVAKVASDFQKPRGFTVVAPGDEKDFFAPLPIGKLPGIGPKSETELKKRGIHKLGDIVARPLEFWRQRWGKVGVALWYESQGRDYGRFSNTPKNHSVSREKTFKVDTQNQTLLQSTLTYLIDKASYDLRFQGAKAQEVKVKVRYEDFATTTGGKKLMLATSNTADLHRVAQDIFERLYKKGQRVRLLGVNFGCLKPHQEQASIFDVLESGERQRQVSVNKAADKIRGRYGFEAISLLGAGREK